MSTHIVPIQGNDPDGTVAQVAAAIRAPASVGGWDAEAGTIILTYAPDLTAGELNTLSDLLTLWRFGVVLTLAEWQAIKGDAAGLRAYLGVASPTLAQTAAATKAIVRVLGTIIRS